ncbi:MAG: hypothetical protein JSV88_14125 [Candidatus Aminicenantes bacterium]|nr:MAG: hypothetical protein JSV88_14125 [Candidatus Aminicenantes bacterium]
MVYNHRMQKNKKIPVSFLLLSIYALFMCQEIMVNQVLCCKDNGTADIELAIFGFQCDCKNKNPHTHLDHSKTKNPRQLSAKSFDCFDLPLANTWMKRNIPNINFEINLVKQYDLNIQVPLQLNDPFRRLPESVPKSKFIYQSGSLVDSVVLRC